MQFTMYLVLFINVTVIWNGSPDLKKRGVSLMVSTYGAKTILMPVFSASTRSLPEEDSASTYFRLSTFGYCPVHSTTEIPPQYIQTIVCLHLIHRNSIICFFFWGNVLLNIKIIHRITICDKDVLPELVKTEALTYMDEPTMLFMSG